MQLTDRDLEAKVDDLVVVNLNGNAAFAEWFLKRVFRSTAVPAYRASIARRNQPRHVVRGQTDIGLELHGELRTHVLIENKVRHHFEPDQPERYREECLGLVDRRIVDAAISVLIAPQRYIEAIGQQVEKFDSHVSYEAIRKCLGGADTLLSKAISHCETGWIAESVAAVCDNFEGYGELVKRAYPELILVTKIGNNPTQSRTAQFDSGFAENTPAGVPYIRLLHQWQQEGSKLLFDGWGHLRPTIGPVLEADVACSGLILDRSKSKSLGVMIRTPRIDNHGDFKTQIDRFIAGLDAVCELRRWYFGHLPTVAKWVTIAASLT